MNKDLKTCVKCHVPQPKSEYYPNKRAADKLAYQCKTCRRKEGKDYHASGRRGEVTRVWKDENPANVLLWNARRRAQRDGLPFDLTVDDIMIPEFCPVLGVRLERGQGKISPAAPSLDRIKPELGYVRGNVQVISHKANRMKSNATTEELLLFADWVRREVGSHY